ncbi:unnamed protein product [Schistocephalus solidus]|uniref:Uncharacterized protein n=1 Tax=Schistocephalus solidus TaxID=70667 RepID=A0A3P7D7G6_SCHSO|nr:unnamed protein product [Schistocephalus solidus]
MAPVSSGGLNTIRSSSSQYGQMVNEKAHEAAIFGTGSVDSLLSRDFGAAALGGRPNEARENLVSVLDTIKDIMHPRVSTSPPLTPTLTLNYHATAEVTD